MTNEVSVPPKKGEEWWRGLLSAQKAAVLKPYFDEDTSLGKKGGKARNLFISKIFGIQTSTVAMQRQWYRQKSQEEKSKWTAPPAKEKRLPLPKRIPQWPLQPIHPPGWQGLRLLAQEVARMSPEVQENEPAVLPDWTETDSDLSAIFSYFYAVEEMSPPTPVEIKKVLPSANPAKEKKCGSAEPAVAQEKPTTEKPPAAKLTEAQMGFRNWKTAKPTPAPAEETKAASVPPKPVPLPAAKTAKPAPPSAAAKKGASPPATKGTEKPAPRFVSSAEKALRGHYEDRDSGPLSKSGTERMSKEERFLNDFYSKKFK